MTDQHQRARGWYDHDGSYYLYEESDKWPRAPSQPPRRFPPIVRAEDMHRECVRDGWQMAPHPILKLRGSDHG